MATTDSTTPPGRMPSYTPPHQASPALVRGAGELTQEFFNAVADGFQEDPDDGLFEHEASLMDPSRQYGFQVDDRWVATAGSAARSMTVPGGRVAVNAVTAVTVAPAFRRRGLLTQMMQAQLREQSEPVALLWSSESAIYGRFGYGEATRNMRVAIPAHESAFQSGVQLSDGSVGEVPSADWAHEAAAIHDRVLPDRPGALTREDRHWQGAIFDPPQRRDGASRRRYVLHFDADGRPDGYASFRIKGSWEQGMPDNELRVNAIEAATPGSYARLWRYLFDMDFIRKVTWRGAPVDLPLYWMLANPRAMVSRQYDATYCRLVDLPTALGARRYRAGLDVVLDLHDPLIEANSGRFRLHIEDSRAGITSTSDPADLTLGIRELGSLYLGGVSATNLAAAGCIAEHRPGAAAELTDAFRWHRAPHCPDDF